MIYPKNMRLDFQSSSTTEKPLDLIKAAFCEPDAEIFHTIPSKHNWKPDPNQPEERICGEIITGTVFNEEYNNICDSWHVKKTAISRLSWHMMAGLMI